MGIVEKFKEFTMSGIIAFSVTFGILLEMYFPKGRFGAIGAMWAIVIVNFFKWLYIKRVKRGNDSQS